MASSASARRVASAVLDRRRTSVNYFGTGVVLPFEIIYLRQARGFPTVTAGLVLAVVMGTVAVLTRRSGALLDRFRAKPILTTAISRAH